VVTACVSSAAVAATVVVTNDARAAAELAALGAAVVADASDAGLNPALVDGARHAAEVHPEASLFAVSSDLPALRVRVLDEVLDAAAGFQRSVVADASGTGTTLLLARRGTDFTPDFGAGSRDRHVQSGAVELDPDRWPQARRDVDTVEDLVAAVGLGLGLHTARFVADRLGLRPGDR
jgi:2-phospho-L-lactate guanylyltransferase